MIRHFAATSAAVLCLTVALNAHASGANGYKCTSRVINDDHEVLVKSANFHYLCTAGSGSCSWNIEVPLYDPEAEPCNPMGTFENAKGYITFFKVDTANDVVSQIQRFGVQLTSQAITGSGSTQKWTATLVFNEQNRGAPSTVTQDSNDVYVDVEVMAINSASSLTISTWTQSSLTDAGYQDVAYTTQTTSTSDPILFAALSGFDLVTDLDTTTTSPLGISLNKFGVETTITQNVGSFTVDGQCFMSTKHGDNTNQASQCSLSYVALRGSSAEVNRLSTQPTLTSTALANIRYSSNVINRTMQGTGNSGAWPTCGIKTFHLTTSDSNVVRLISPAVNEPAKDFHQKALAFGIRDCDTQVLGSGQSSIIEVSGASVYDPNANNLDMSSGLFVPVSSPLIFYEHQLRNSSLETNTVLKYTPALELDGVGLD